LSPTGREGQIFTLGVLPRGAGIWSSSSTAGGEAHSAARRMRAAIEMRPEGVRKDEVSIPKASAYAEVVAVRWAGEPARDGCGQDGPARQSGYRDLGGHYGLGVPRKKTKTEGITPQYQIRNTTAARMASFTATPTTATRRLFTAL